MAVNLFLGGPTEPITALGRYFKKRGFMVYGHGKLYGTFRLNFHHFDRFELDLRGHTQP